MNRDQLTQYLEEMDRHLQKDSILYVYGAAAWILLGEIDRTSLDIDVAAPYSHADFSDLRQAAEKAGLKINPDETTQADHVEWITALRLSLPPPDKSTEMELWRGRKLTVRTVSPAQLVASKLIRYDATDQSDIRYLCFQRKLTFEEIADAVATLPAPFRDDAIVRDNLNNLRADMKLWERDQP